MIFRELSNAASRFSLRRPGAEIIGGGGGGVQTPPPPSRRWKIQRPSRVRINFYIKSQNIQESRKERQGGVCAGASVGPGGAGPGLRQRRLQGAAGLRQETGDRPHHQQRMKVTELGLCRGRRRRHRAARQCSGPTRRRCKPSSRRRRGDRAGVRTTRCWRDDPRRRPPVLLSG